MYGIAICVEAVYICLICLACKNRVTVRSKWSRMDKKVLILEDDFSNADIIKQLIKEYDKCIKVYIESNVNNAYALVMENRIHLFVIDIILDTSCQGDTSGIKFAESVRSIAIVNDIRNFVFGLAGATVYGSCKSRKQKFVMSFTISISIHQWFLSRH